MNEQLPIRVDRRDDGALLVHSIFPTIQGEGPFAGQFALFIRLFGCNLQCPGCDTDYTSSSNLHSPEELLAVVQGMLNPEGLVVITGGEPFRQNITPLTMELLEDGFRVQVETNGTSFLPISDMTTVVVSPKTARIHPELALRANAYKYVLRAGEVADDGLPTVALGYTGGLGMQSRVARPPEGWEGPIYLQPMDEKDEVKNAANAQACVHTILTHQKYILGFQMHKGLGLP
jgi:7-carboxy-7-deazaguanine synthase